MFLDLQLLPFWDSRGATVHGRGTRRLNGRVFLVFSLNEMFRTRTRCRIYSYPGLMVLINAKLLYQSTAHWSVLI